MADFEEVPEHLVVSKHTKQAETTPQTEGSSEVAEVPSENIPATEQLPNIPATPSVFGPEHAGIISGGLAGTGTMALQRAKNMKRFAEDVIGRNIGKPSLQTYANSQVGDRYNVPLKDLQKLAGMEHPLNTQTMVQQAVKNISGSPAVPRSREPIFDAAGRQTGWRQIPGSPAVSPIDLSAYEKPTGIKAVGQGVKNFVGAPLRAGAAGYDIGAGLQNLSQGNVDLGASQIGAGGLMALAPLAAQKIKPAVGKAMTTLGALPIVGQAMNHMIGSAEAAPMTREEKMGTAANIATSLIPGPVGTALSLLKPTELGSEDVYRGRQGTNPLKGTGSVMENYVPRRAAGGAIKPVLHQPKDASTLFESIKASHIVKPKK